VAFNSEESDHEDNSSQSSDSEDEEEESKTKSLPSTTVIISIHNKKTDQNDLFKVLLDTGTSRCMMTKQAGLKLQLGTPHHYNAAAGKFHTTHSTRVRKHRMLELNSRGKLRNLWLQVTERKLGPYDFIFGRDYMNRYGIDLLFSQQVI